jgi:hypothetical protein
MKFKLYIVMFWSHLSEEETKTLAMNTRGGTENKHATTDSMEASDVAVKTSMFRGKKPWLVIVGVVAACIHTVDIAGNVALLGATEVQAKNEPHNEHCAIHVHGLHHTGTGYLREVVYESVGGARMASKHHKTGAPEDEGQHLQDVFPADRKRRNKHICGKTHADLYVCQEMIDTLPNNETNKIKLHEEWSKHWNTTKEFLIQKSPTLDVVFLERMQVLPTFHVIIMRHPHCYRNTFWPTLWLNVWTSLLEQLSDRMVESFALINYETLSENRAAVKNELSALVEQQCKIPIPSDDTTEALNRVTRRLELHTTKNSSQYTVAPKIIRSYEYCLENDMCREEMQKTESMLSKIGYSWDPRLPFHLPKNGKDDSLFLFSTHHLPSKELVEEMKQATAPFKSYPEFNCTDGWWSGCGLKDELG